jgi:hypothetical protein
VNTPECLVDADCDDLDACTADSCGADGCCVNTPECLVDADCDDLDACTDDSCGAGGCCVYSPVDCSNLDDDCNMGVCLPGTGQCDQQPTNEGGSCDSGLGVCLGGTCVMTCSTIGDCADTDENGVRDDPCLWWSCDVGTCNSLAIGFADMGGQFGTCPPDGATDTNDRFHALNCFADMDTGGAPGYPCESSPPQAFNVDAGGPFGDCDPDGVCDANDAFHALNTFEGSSTCTCDGPMPGSPGQSPVRTVEHAAIVAESSRIQLRPGGLVQVNLFLDGALHDLRGYQLHVGVSGGRSGSLELVDIFVDAEQSPVFHKVAAWSAFNVRTGQMAAGLDQPGIAAASGSYLATFIYRASDDAAGRFFIEALAGEDAAQRTFLFPTPADGRIAVTDTSPAIVEVFSGRSSKRAD